MLTEPFNIHQEAVIQINYSWEQENQVNVSSRKGLIYLSQHYLTNHGTQTANTKSLPFLPSLYTPHFYTAQCTKKSPSPIPIYVSGLLKNLGAFAGEQVLQYLLVPSLFITADDRQSMLGFNKTLDV